MSFADENERIVDQAKISATNKAINSFFRGRSKNAQRHEWFTPSRCLIPESLREITNAIGKFFVEKAWYAGGSIPDELLYTKRNYHLINNISLLEAVELCYDSIEEGKSLSKSGYEPDCEIEITLGILRECHRRGIPQEHIAGLLVLYFELCEKVVLL